MAILEHEVRPASGPAIGGVHRHLLSRQDWRKMGNEILAGQRVELFEGEIIEMAPIEDWHAALTDPLAMLLRAAFGAGYTVRSQVPISLGDDKKPSEPQPDITVVIGSWRDYGTRTPEAKDIRLVVEVADSSGLMYDRTFKAALYASAGIPENWIVDLLDNCLEVYREPANTTYKSMTVYKRAERVSPLHAPKSAILVSDCLP